MYRSFRRCVGRLGGLIAAAAAPASMMWLDPAPSAEIDMLQLAWVAGALLCLLRSSGTTGDGERISDRRGKLAMAASGPPVRSRRRASRNGRRPPSFTSARSPFSCAPTALLLWSWPHLLSLLVAFPCLGWAAAVAGQVGWRRLFDTVCREALQHLSPLHHSRPYPWGEIVAFLFCFWRRTCPGRRAVLLTFHPKFAGLWDEARPNGCCNCCTAGSGRICCFGASCPAITSVTECRCNRV